MQVFFIKDGGFNKTGGFVERDNTEKSREAVYQRQGYLNVDVKCRDILITNDFFPYGVKEKVICRRISATGDLGDLSKDRWGRWQLSILGSELHHKEISVSIRESPDNKENFWAGAMLASRPDEFDVHRDEGFYVELTLSPERISHLVEELSASPCDLILRVSFQKFSNFLAEWSPSINEGRVIKFLVNRSDVENQDDIPKDFLNIPTDDEELSLYYENPVGLEVTKPLPTLHKKVQENNAQEDKEVVYWKEEETSEHEKAKPVNDTAQAIAVLSANIVKSASKIKF